MNDYVKNRKYILKKPYKSHRLQTDQKFRNGLNHQKVKLKICRKRANNNLIFQKILLKFKVSKTTIKLRTAFQTEQFFWNCLCNYKRFCQVNKKSFLILLFLPQLLFKISFQSKIEIELKNLYTIVCQNLLCTNRKKVSSKSLYWSSLFQ